MLVAAAIAAALLTGGTAQDAPSAPPTATTCNTGPVEREYGGLPWLVFSCSNGGVVFGGKPGSPAGSSLFVWAPSAEGFSLTLETDLTDRAPLEAATAHLSALTVADLQALVAETHAVAAH